MNWLYKISLQKIASVELYYHGTSASKLKSILSEGLNTEHELAWGKDEGTDRSRVSFGGIYVTKNLMTAIGAGGQANRAFGLAYGDPRAIIMIQLENRTPSILIDEDRLPDINGCINRTFNVNSNEWWYQRWVDNSFNNIDSAVEDYIRSLNLSWKIPNSRFTDNLKPYIADMIKAWARREVAIGIKHSDQYHINRMKNETPLFNPEEYTLDKTDSAWRAAANTFMQKATRLASFSTDSYSENVRVLDPITFSGRNKIVFAAIFHKDEKYYEKVTVLFNRNPQAFEMFKKDYFERVGKSSIMVDQNGQVLYQPSSRSEPDPTVQRIVDQDGKVLYQQGEPKN